MVSPLAHGECLTYAGEIGGEHDKPIYLNLKTASSGANRNVDSKVTQIPVFTFNNVQFIKDKLRAQVRALKNVKANKIKLTYKGVEIKQGKLVNDYNLEGTKQNPTTIEYEVICNQVDHEGTDIELIVDEMVLCTKKMENRILEGRIALNAGLVPRLAEDGTGGTYFIPHPMGRGYAPLGCFKPKDEEPCAPNNPRGFQGKENADGFRPGIYSTQCAYREVCAFLLDHSSFVGVPDTALVHARHESFNNPGKIVWKTGSYQEFVEAKETAGNFHPRVYSTEDVHRIGIFDVRVVNMDRNDGNILVRTRGKKDRPSSSKYQLVPIDHGLILPDRLEIIEEDIVWMSWPKAKEPFSKTCIDFIRSLNYIKESRDAEKYLGIKKDPLRLMKCTTILLQVGVLQHGLSLYDIGQIMYRQDIDEPSVLQDILTTSLDAALMFGGVRQTRSPFKVGAESSNFLLGLNLETSRMASKRTLTTRPSNFVNSLKAGVTSDDNTSSTTSPNPEANPANENKRNQSDGSDGWTSPAGSPQMTRSITPPESFRALDISIKNDGLTLLPAENQTNDSYFEDGDGVNWNGVGRVGVGTAVRMNPPEASMSIFSRPDDKGKETVTWTDDLERVFLDHVKQGINAHINIQKIRKPDAPFYGKQITY